MRNSKMQKTLSISLTAVFFALLVLTILILIVPNVYAFYYECYRDEECDPPTEFHVFRCIGGDCTDMGCWDYCPAR